MKFWFRVIKSAVKDFLEDKALRLAAALAYYALFSLAPLLIIVMALVSSVGGFVLGQENLRQEIQQQLAGVLGEQSASTISSMMAARELGSSTLAMILGVGALLLGASGLFGQMQDALNTIWEVKAKASGGLWRLVRDRFLSLTMVLGLGFLLLISMVLTTAVEAMTTGMGRLFPIPDAVTVTLSLVVSFAVVFVLFTLILKVLPDVKVPWKVALVGGAATAILFTLGKWGLSQYLGKESTSSAYGAAGSVVIILLWVYYSSVILFMGAEITQAYATEKGIQLKTSEYARPVTPEARAQEGLETEPGVPRPAIAFVSTRAESREGPLAALQRDTTSHPWRSVFLAWGFGLMTGWMFRRKITPYAKL